MICPSCKKEIRDGLKFCNKCGAKIESAEPVSEKTESESKVICPNCGKELKPGQKFCNGCGTKIEATNSAEPPKTSSQTKSPKISENTQPPVNNNNIIDYRDTIFGTKIDLNMSSFVTYKGNKLND